jgi:phage terminase large subunit GpA-like protein
MPHIKEPMDKLSSHVLCEKVVCMFPVQMAKTEIGLNWQGYIVDHSPAPTLSVQPTLELRDRYVAQRINPLLEDTEVLAKKFDNKVSRSASNAKDLKDFEGGILVLGGANAASSLSSMPIRNVIADELDRFMWTLKGEGDPLGLIEGRQSNFNRRKSLYISSPTMKGASRIEEEFEGGDQRYRQVPCPHCGAWLELKWKQLHWQAVDGQVLAAWYVCEHCGCEIEEHEKARMLGNDVARWFPHKPHAPYASYTINALYSPLGMGWGWLKLAQEWLKVQGDVAKLKRFVNTRLAETWDAKGKIKPRMIQERAEDYGLRTVPPGCLVLTCGIDTQDDRLAVQLVGHGRDGLLFVLDYFELPGVPSDLVDEFLRGEGKLFTYLTTPLQNAWGKTLRIRASAWDTGGHYTDDIYRAIRQNKSVPLLMAIKGLSVKGKPILSPRPSKQDVNLRGKVIRGGVALWGIGTDTVKDYIFSRLESDEDKDAGERKFHFSAELDDDYYDMLTAEVFDPEKNRYVKKSGARNEALDTLGYAIAASRHPKLRLHATRAKDWDALERLLQPENMDKAEAETETRQSTKDEDMTQAAKRPRKQGRKRRRGGFVSGW